jgi:hypothetical protein
MRSALKFIAVKRPPMPKVSATAATAPKACVPLPCLWLPPYMVRTSSFLRVRRLCSCSAYSTWGPDNLDLRCSAPETQRRCG